VRRRRGTRISAWRIGQRAAITEVVITWGSCYRLQSNLPDMKQSAVLASQTFARSTASVAGLPTRYRELSFIQRRYAALLIPIAWLVNLIDSLNLGQLNPILGRSAHRTICPPFLIPPRLAVQLSVGLLSHFAQARLQCWQAIPCPLRKQFPPCRMDMALAIPEAEATRGARHPFPSQPQSRLTPYPRLNNVRRRCSRI